VKLHKKFDLFRRDYSDVQDFPVRELVVTFALSNELTLSEDDIARGIERRVEEIDWTCYFRTVSKDLILELTLLDIGHLQQIAKFCLMKATGSDDPEKNPKGGENEWDIFCLGISTGEPGMRERQMLCSVMMASDEPHMYVHLSV